MAAAPFAGYNMVLVEPAMGFHQGCARLMLRAGFHLITPLAVAGSATRTSSGGGYGVAVPLAAGSLTAATGGLTYFGGRNAPSFGAGSRGGPRIVCAATAGHGDGPVALAAVSYSSAGLVGVVAGTAGSGRSRGMSVVAKAGDEPTDPEDDSYLEKMEEYYRKRQSLIDPVLKEIKDFDPEIAMPMPGSFGICQDKDVLLRFERKFKVCYGPLFETTLDFHQPTAMNREALITIAKDLKMVALECEKGFLQAKTLDKAVASLKALRATSLGCPEDEVMPLKTSIPTPRPPVKDDSDDQVSNYFVFMTYHLAEVMEEVIVFTAKHR